MYLPYIIYYVDMHLAINGYLNTINGHPNSHITGLNYSNSVI